MTTTLTMTTSRTTSPTAPTAPTATRTAATAPGATPSASAVPATALPSSTVPTAAHPASPALAATLPAPVPTVALPVATVPAPAPAPGAIPTSPATAPASPVGGAARRPRTPRPRTAPGGPAGTRPRGSAGTRPRTPERGAPRALPPHTVFAERLLAVLSGERPVHWMLGHTLGEAYEQLVRLAPETPLRSHGPRPVLRRCSVQAHPAQGAVEAFATIATGARVRAMAFRLERGADLRWRCAAVELDGLGTT
ncbi:Rv3235 family protein [Streptomyces sp. NPDC056528]|uniref:Rv3235 family protein n=1 Tax=Streptomyces sp. NPDC056528 TaxID=3345854 RepID=UPI0036992A85